MQNKAMPEPFEIDCLISRHLFKPFWLRSILTSLLPHQADRTPRFGTFGMILNLFFN